MNAIKNKIRSQRGASITFALLLFLVCAVLSSVIIVAATTAAGRMSGLKETDQRYYAAIAAADTLKGIFDGKQAEVTYGPDTVDPELSSSSFSNLLEDYSYYVAKNPTYSGTIPSATITNDNAEGYTCTVQPKLEGGLLTFEIKAVGGTENINTGTYTLSIVFASNVKNPSYGESTATKKTTVSWRLHSLKKGRAATSSD